MKSGSLNLLEPSGPHWACYGTPLPLPFEKNTYRGFVEKHEAERPPGRLGIDGRVILKLILKQQDGMAWTGRMWL